MTMERRHDDSVLETARKYAALGWPIIPLKGKIPAAKGWQQFKATEAAVAFWFGPARSANIGLRTGESGFVVVDVDTPEAEAWVQRHLPETPMQALSGSGSKHRYFQAPPRKEIRNKQAWKGIHGLDVRGHGGFIVLPGSIHPATGRRYEWLTPILPPSTLPRFSASWVYERPRKSQTAIGDALDASSMLHRGKLYVDRFAPAMSGRGGHRALFVAALKIATFVGKDPSIAWQLLLYYNATKCFPPWDPTKPEEERALKHKLDDALKKAR